MEADERIGIVGAHTSGATVWRAVCDPCEYSSGQLPSAEVARNLLQRHQENWCTLDTKPTSPDR